MKGRVLIVLCVLSVLATIMATESYSTMGFAVEVAQPIIDPEGVIRISRVTYLTYIGGTLVGLSIPYTCAVNCVTTAHDGCGNRNAASYIGLKSGVICMQGEEQALFGDTLKVFFDLSEVHSSEEWPERLPIETIIRETYRCVLLNASKDREGYNREGEMLQAKYLELEIRGSEKYTSWAGVYAFDEELGQFPARR